MKKIKNQKGITLVALVVTIIVLIILAGISINLLLGDNGIIKKAQAVSDKYKEAANEENIKLSDLDERLNGIINGIENNTPPAVTGTLGTAINSGNYGNIVYNYTAADLVWRLFYEDSNNIYLISETNTGDYPLNNVQPCIYEDITHSPSDYSPKDASYVSGESVSQQGKDLMPLLGGATSSIVGTNSSATNLLTSSNTNVSIWAISYFCDISKWTTYKTGLASWAMGAPTIELFAASYNATHQGGNQISLGIGTYGYTENTSSGWFLKEENGGIYRLTTNGGWWISAPRDDNAYMIRTVGDGGGGFGNGFANMSASLRPIVCISKSTGFVCSF